jgi:hypothetical protein
MKITITGTDFLISDASLEVVAIVAANKAADAFLYARTDGNHLRTAFGFTLYVKQGQEVRDMIAAIKAEGMTYAHADI